MTIKILSIIGMLLIAVTVVESQNSDRCDSSCIKEVKTILKQNEISKGFLSSWVEKANNRLGDRFAIALEKIYRKDKKDKFFTPSKIRSLLPLFRNAFAFYNEIREEEDRIPTNTLLLLEKMKLKISDIPLEQEIKKAIDFIREKTEKNIDGKIYKES